VLLFSCLAGKGQSLVSVISFHAESRQENQFISAPSPRDVKVEFFIHQNQREERKVAFNVTWRQTRSGKYIWQPVAASFAELPCGILGTYAMSQRGSNAPAYGEYALSGWILVCDRRRTFVLSALL